MKIDGVAFALLLVLMVVANVSLMNTDVGRTVYCWGKIDAIDPWC